MFEDLKGAVASLYEGRMTVFEYLPIKNEETGITSHQEVEVMANIPCRLSYSDDAAVTEGNAVNENIQKIKVFFAPGIHIKPGSKLLIRQHGVIAEYKSSGIPKVYSSHTEVNLEYFDRWT